MKEITKEEYDNAISVIKDYTNQEYDKLPYTLGLIQFIDGKRYMEARKMKDTGTVLAIFRNVPEHMDGGDKYQLLEVTEPIIAKSYKEHQPEIKLEIFNK